MEIRHVILGGVCAMMLAACAHSEHAGGFGKAEPSRFLKDYSKLHAAANDTEATLVYFPDKAKFKTYTKIWLEPVQVWRGEGSDAKGLDKEEADYLSKFLWSRLDEELCKDYTMVQGPGPGVMRMRVAIRKPAKTFRFWTTSRRPIRLHSSCPRGSRLSWERTPWSARPRSN